MAATKIYAALAKSIKVKFKRERKENKKLFNLLKKEKPAGYTKAFRQFNDEAFRNHNCLNCANCCRTALAVFEEPDVRRISKHLGMTRKDFIKKYLKPDPDYEFLIKVLPCTFLLPDNKCSIYEVRPAGCRTYPPAKLQLSAEQLDVIYDNIDICPAVDEMVDKMKEKFLQVEFSSHPLF